MPSGRKAAAFSVRFRRDVDRHPRTVTPVGGGPSPADSGPSPATTGSWGPDRSTAAGTGAPAARAFLRSSLLREALT
jgi:hypothetical protein